MRDLTLAVCCGNGALSLEWPIRSILKKMNFNYESLPIMPQNITKSAKSIVKDALEKVPAISTDDAIALVNSDDHVFVDLRDGTEQAKIGIIPGAVASSRGMMEFHIDPESPAHKAEFNQDKTYVFYCASGGRSAMAALIAMDMGLKPVLNMSGGFGAWKKAGGPVA